MKNILSAYFSTTHSFYRYCNDHNYQNGQSSLQSNPPNRWGDWKETDHWRGEERVWVSAVQVGVQEAEEREEEKEEGTNL